MADQVLPVELISEAGLIESPEGNPVWPVRDEAELNALSITAELFGGKLDRFHREGRRIVRQGAGGPGEVVALGEEVHGEAALYAHLTRRALRTAAGIDAMLAGTPPEVIVTTAAHLDDEFLHRVWGSAEATTCPGVLCEFFPGSLRRQVLTRAAAAVLSGLPPVRQINLFPNLECGPLPLPEREVYGGETGAAELKQALSKGAGVLSVHTHSDGIDAFLGRNLVLCPLDRAPAGADESRCPRCRCTEYCHRTNLPVPEAWNSGRLVPPEIFSARVLIWNVCWGVLPSRGAMARVLDGRWGIMPRFLSSPKLGAVLTTWQMTISDLNATERLEAMLAAGMPAGTALARFLNSPPARALGQRFCLFGDPRVCVPEPRRGRKREAGTRDRRVKLFGPVPRGEGGRPQRAAAFLRAWLAEALSGCSETAFQSAQSAMAAVQAYEQYSWRGIPCEGSNESPGPIMRKAVLGHLSNFGTLISKDWLRFAGPRHRIVPEPACFACGKPLNSYRIRPRVPGTDHRRISMCPQCGIVEDAPVGSDIGISLAGQNGIRLSGELPDRDWHAVLVAGSHLQSDFKAWAWPADADNRAVTSFEAAEPWPPGPLRVVFMIMWNAELAIVQQPGRSPS